MRSSESFWIGMQCLGYYGLKSLLISCDGGVESDRTYTIIAGLRQLHDAKAAIEFLLLLQS
jgi:hypothetical protein